MEGRPVTLEMVRQAAQTLCEGGKTVSNHQIFAALALDCEPEKARARSRITNMVKHGEMTREADGLYRYNFAKRPRNPRTYAVIWRFVRKQKPGWTITECAMLTRVSYRQVHRYCEWLLEEGYIAGVGKKGLAQLYRAATKADRTPETPYPPLRETDPFAREKAAAVRIIDLLLRADPYAVKTARGITDACTVLLARFASTVATKKATDEDSMSNNFVCSLQALSPSVSPSGNGCREKNRTKTENEEESHVE